MITNSKEKKVCDKYSIRDEFGNVHCFECQLSRGAPDSYDYHCKANSHYNRKTKEWEYDE